MKRLRLYWICQLVGWGTYVVLMAVFNKINGNELNTRLLMNLLSTFLLGVSTSHLYRNFIIRYNWLNLKIAQLIPRVLLASLLLAVIFYAVHTVLSNLIDDNAFSFEWIDVLQNLINLSVNYILWTLLYWSFHFIENYRKEEIKNLRWQATIRELELNKIKSQLNPHFIFNSMNSIRALVDESPGKAKNLITQLSNILRSTLYMDRKPVITLKEELSLVKDYLELEKARLEERLQIEIAVEDACFEFNVPPLLIQTLVENGIKHGIAKLEKGGKLEIRGYTASNQLVLEITNSGAFQQHNGNPGIGLKISRQRLKLLYGNESKLEIHKQEGHVLARLLIPGEPITIHHHESTDH